MIVEKKLRGVEGVNSVDVVVNVRGLRITVKPLTFVVAEKSYELAEDYEFLVEPEADVVLHVSGFLAEDRESGDAVVVVSETRAGETPYGFDDASPYQVLHMVFAVDVPPNAYTLDEVEIRVRKLLPEEESQDVN